MDVLSYCIIEALSDPEKAKQKEEDTNISWWFQVCFRYFYLIKHTSGKGQCEMFLAKCIKCNGDKCVTFIAKFQVVFCVLCMNTRSFLNAMNWVGRYHKHDSWFGVRSPNVSVNMQLLPIVASIKYV